MLWRIEIVPTSDIVHKVQRQLPPGSNIAVTCLPHHGPDRTMHVARLLSDEGYRVTPHLAARTIRGKSHLRQLIRDCRRSGISDALVISGDSPEVSGSYPSAVTLMRDISEISSGELSLTIAGYPEGHPQLNSVQLLRALLQKHDLAVGLVTQMCFSPTKVLDYLKFLRNEGINLPVFAGVPGRIERARLVALANRVGVGPSIRLLSRKGPLARRLLSGGNYSPQSLTAELENAGLAGIHLYSFNSLDLPSSAEPAITAQQTRNREHALR